MARPRKPRVDATLSLTTPGSSRRELWEDVARTLREAILAGGIRAGASLVEADLADRFDVSRGPIRDALRELAREGLVVSLPRRGTVVSTLSFADIQEVYDVREGLEIAAARLAIERASDAQLAELRTSVRALEAAWDRDEDYADSLALDLAIHRQIVGLASNGRLQAVYEQMLIQTQLNAVTAAELNPSLRRGMKRAAHRDILRALRARDADGASHAISDHYAYARERLLSGYPAPEDDAIRRS